MVSEHQAIASGVSRGWSVGSNTSSEANCRTKKEIISVKNKILHRQIIFWPKSVPTSQNKNDATSQNKNGATVQNENDANLQKKNVANLQKKTVATWQN